MTELVEYKDLPVKIPKMLADQHPELISQGAEALVFTIPESDKIAKYRPAKPWRLQELDDLLRKRRTTQEVRVMKKVEPQVDVPKILWTDASLGLIYMELVKGISLKQATWNETGRDQKKPSDANQMPESAEVEVPESVLNLYRQLGTAVAKVHAMDVVHGDLTTSNVMVAPDPGFPHGRVKIIDFGLSAQTPSIEQMAVDLYVLERAIQSTHPLESSILMHETFMPAYTEYLNSAFPQKSRGIIERLQVVRKRGRKRTQLG